MFHFVDVGVCVSDAFGDGERVSGTEESSAAARGAHFGSARIPHEEQCFWRNCQVRLLI